MTTLDGDWICDDEEDGQPEPCFAVWDECPDCLRECSELPCYTGGLAAKGCGIPFDESYGNLWYELRDMLEDKYDICLSCTGSGGAYICGVHDIEPPTPTR